MAGNALAGDIGERDVVDKVACPNCGNSLMLLPKNYPLCDVQCTGCVFRAQIKTNNSKPKSIIFGAGWEIMSKTLKAGYLVPPLITNFVWIDKTTGLMKQEIRLYPFVLRKNLVKRTLSETARRANYKMFNYVGLDLLPSFILYKE